jgi:HAD superfamily hydrolase (TIGR01662 family)
MSKPFCGGKRPLLSLGGSAGITIKSALFDLDGTLIDSVPAYFRLMEVILETVGLPPVPKSVVAEFMSGGVETLEKMIPVEMKDRQEAMIQECITVGRKMSRNMFRDEVELFPGVQELFSLLADRRISIGVVTSTRKRNIERKLAPMARNRVRDALDVVIAIEDAPKRKPAPDPLIECARRLAVQPEKCVFVGDSQVDIRAGKAAGMMTIGVLTGLDDYDTLKRENPTMILESVSDIRNLI